MHPARVVTYNDRASPIPQCLFYAFSPTRKIPSKKFDLRLGHSCVSNHHAAGLLKHMGPQDSKNKKSMNIFSSAHSKLRQKKTPVRTITLLNSTRHSRPCRALLYPLMPGAFVHSPPYSIYLKRSRKLCRQSGITSRATGTGARKDGRA